MASLVEVVEKLNLFVFPCLKRDNISSIYASFRCIILILIYKDLDEIYSVCPKNRLHTLIQIILSVVSFILKTVVQKLPQRFIPLKTLHSSKVILV